MKEIIPYIDIILIALVAIFLLFKLRAILGKRIGYQKSEVPSKLISIPKPLEHDSSNIGNEKNIQNNNYPLGSLAYKVKEIEIKDNSFEQSKFTHNAQSAFKMILEAFSSGNIEKIENFVSANIYLSFKNSIIQMRESNKKLLISIKSFLITDIIGVEENPNGNTSITIKFITDQLREEIELDNNSNNNYETVFAKGNNSKSFTDIWTFSKKLNDNSSIWKLTKTA